MIAGLSTCAPIKALRWCTGQGGHLTCAPAVAWLALTAEGPMGVHADSTIEANTRLAALVNVIAAVFSLEARRTGTVIVVIPIDTSGSIGTGTCRTSINEGAVLASEPSLAHTSVLCDTIEHLALARCSILTL